MCKKEWRKKYEKIYKKEGGTKAITNSNAVSYIKGKTITYGAKDCSSYYQTAMKVATDKLSATSSQITIKVNTSVNSGNYYAGQYEGDKTGMYKKGTKTFQTLDYVLKYDNVESYDVVKNANAFNSLSNNSSLSYIFFNKSYMDGYTQDAKTMLAMHELGHTIGFIDFYSGSYVYDNDATVMKGVYQDGYTVFTDYTDFDKQCIEDVYGE